MALVNCADCPFTASENATAIGGFDCPDGSIKPWGGVQGQTCTHCSYWAIGACFNTAMVPTLGSDSQITQQVQKKPFIVRTQPMTKRR